MRHAGYCLRSRFEGHKGRLCAKLVVGLKKKDRCRDVGTKAGILYLANQFTYCDAKQIRIGVPSVRFAVRAVAAVGTEKARKW